MSRNMGGADRAVRLVVGLALVGWAWSSGAWWGWLGLIPIATALIGWCPAYVPFGWTTCRPRTPAGG